jgi:hypothetical protein
MRCGEPVPWLDARMFGTRTLCAACFRVELAAWTRAEKEKEETMEELNLPGNRGAKVTEDQVREIRRKHAQGSTLAHLAEEYGLTMASVSNIVRRKTWAHVK